MQCILIPEIANVRIKSKNISITYIMYCVMSLNRYYICRMLDENFQDQMEEIVKLSPRGRQTMLFSATMTDEVHYCKLVYIFIL